MTFTIRMRAHGLPSVKGSAPLVVEAMLNVLTHGRWRASRSSLELIREVDV